MRKSKVYQVSNEDFINIVNNSISYSECLRKLGLETKGGSSTDVLKQRIEELHCDITHFHGNCGKKLIKKLIPLEDILIENSTYLATSSLKNRLIKSNLLEYKCYNCGLQDWMGKPISLQLDHINGINNDNRLENLRLLCPNCHSQTNTFSGRNKKKRIHTCVDCGVQIHPSSTRCPKCASAYRQNCTVTNKPSKEELLELIKTKSFVEIGRMYNVSDNNIRKWCKKYGIPSTKKELKSLRVFV